MSPTVIARPLAAALLGLLALRPGPARRARMPMKRSCCSRTSSSSTIRTCASVGSACRPANGAATKPASTSAIDFRNAARYGDKLSEQRWPTCWNGQGGPADRALGYAWMDLAAERGTEWLVVQRERFWEALIADERERAVRETARCTPVR